VEAVLPEDCERARAWASLALDCELSQLERAHLRAHLDGCASCAVFVAGLREVTEELRAAPLPAPSRPLAPKQSRIGPVLLALLVVAASAALGSTAGSLRTGQTAVARTVPHGLPGSRLPLRAAV
jgi:hypothetical protein